NDLDQTIKNLYQRIYDIKLLKSINEQIWHNSYERNQIAIQILNVDSVLYFSFQSLIVLFMA
ncbi:hypothetical protein OC715_02430, partial ['Bituminaria bituminosa' little leaf phytoplasma]